MTRLVDTVTTPLLLKLVQAGKLRPAGLVTIASVSTTSCRPTTPSLTPPRRPRSRSSRTAVEPINYVHVSPRSGNHARTHSRDRVVIHSSRNDATPTYAICAVPGPDQFGCATRAEAERMARSSFCTPGECNGHDEFRQNRRVPILRTRFPHKRGTMCSTAQPRQRKPVSLRTHRRMVLSDRVALRQAEALAPKISMRQFPCGAMNSFATAFLTCRIANALGSAGGECCGLGVPGQCRDSAWDSAYALYCSGHRRLSADDRLACSPVRC